MTLKQVYDYVGIKHDFYALICLALWVELKFESERSESQNLQRNSMDVNVSGLLFICIKHILPLECFEISSFLVHIHAIAWKITLFVYVLRNWLKRNMTNCIPDFDHTSSCTCTFASLHLTVDTSIFEDLGLYVKPQSHE